MIEQAFRDRRLAKIRPAYFPGSVTAAAERYRSDVSPRLLIVETDDPAILVLEQIELLSTVCQAETELILLGRHNDVGLYRKLTQNGVRDYIPLPADPASLIDAILAAGMSPGEPRLGRLISFIGASGGAGSSTMAGNIAWQLGRTYTDEAALIDLDAAFGTVGLDFNLESPQTTALALAQADSLDDQMLGRFLARYNDNLVLLTGAGDGSTPVEIDVAALDKLLHALRGSASWVIADLPRYWSSWVRHVLDASDEIVLTAVPTLGSLRNARSAAETLNAGRQNDAPVRVVLNRVGASPKTEISTKDFANTLGAPPAAIVPYEPMLFASAVTTGQVVGEMPKGQRVREPIERLAGLVSGRRSPFQRAGSGIIGQLHRLLAWPRPGVALGQPRGAR